MVMSAQMLYFYKIVWGTVNIILAKVYRLRCHEVSNIPENLRLCPPRWDTDVTYLMAGFPDAINTYRIVDDLVIGQKDMVGL